MDNNSILLLTKDAFCKAYLPCYGNTYYQGKTPNLDELVKKGTKFLNFFTAAPSSAMSYLSMFTMKYPYQHEMKTYVPLLKPYDGRTLFDEAYDKGYDCHVVWDAAWVYLAQDYSKCYGEHTKIHNLKDFRQPVGSQYKHEGVLKRNVELEKDGFKILENELKSIFKDGKKVFLWCHLPHVLKGRVSYGDDIDLYDKYVALFRQYFKDENIFISADHGNMNGLKGKIGYGFDVYDTAVSIPLITPRIDNMVECDKHVCNIDIYDLIFNRKIVEREFIYSDSAYYAQPHRKLGVIWKNFRYIYNKKDRTEELYDIEWDPNQNFNLIQDEIYDIDRKSTSPSREYFFYPRWDELPEIREKLRNEKDKIWREAKGTSKGLYAIYLSIRKMKAARKILRPFVNTLRH